MYSHVVISVSQFDRAFTFYAAVMQALGQELRFREDAAPWAGWHSPGGQRPLFILCTPYDGQPHDPGNGQMVAFAAPSRDVVRRVHAAALAQGGRCDGPPGLRPHYHPDYYGAYFKDLDGNKICVACHAPQTE